MNNQPYEKFEPSRLILRDHLAADRTVLANERTLLAYIRTALTVLVAALSLIQFFKLKYIQIVGFSLIPVSAIVLVIGIVRYFGMRGALRAVRK